LRDGQLVKAGVTSEVIEEYASASAVSASHVEIREEDHAVTWGGSSSMQLESVRLLDSTSGVFQVRWGQPIRLELRYRARVPLRGVVFSVAITSAQGIEVFGSHSDHALSHTLETGRYRVTVTLDNPLRAGLYQLSCGADIALGSAPLFQVPKAATLEVLDVGIDGRTHPQYRFGLIDTPAAWSAPERVRESGVHEHVV